MSAETVEFDTLQVLSILFLGFSLIFFVPFLAFYTSMTTVFIVALIFFGISLIIPFYRRRIRT